MQKLTDMQDLEAAVLRSRRRAKGNWICACDGIGRHARFRFSCSNACGFESLQAHQTQIIRTKSSLWEMGSDYLFTSRGLRIPISKTVWSSGLSPNREGRGRSRPYKRKREASVVVCMTAPASFPLYFTYCIEKDRHFVYTTCNNLAWVGDWIWMNLLCECM